MDKLTRFKFIVPPKDDLKCQVCKEVATEPYQHASCGKLFCSTCLVNQDKPCIYCGGSKGFGFFKDERSKKDINGLLVKCINSFGCHSCQWRGVFSNLEAHYKNCDFARIPCPNQCLKDDGHGDAVKTICRTSLHEHLELHCANREHACPRCGEVMMFREYTTHAERSCPARDYQCLHCSKVMPLSEYPAHKTSCLIRQRYECPYCNIMMKNSEKAAHDNTCQKKPVECPHARLGCNSKVQRRSIRKHLLDSCGYAEVACKYVRIGCKTRMPRADIHTHEKDDKHHFPMALNKLMEVDTRLEKSNSRVTLCSGKNTTFKLSNYQRHKENQETFTSPEFSTPSGHSMTIRVQFSGNQISLSTKLIESPGATGSSGEAFNGNITIFVLNQLQDDSHLSKSGVQNSSKFSIAYTRIQSTDLGVQYLKEDTLYFRVAMNTPKPWLECTEI